MKKIYKDRLPSLIAYLIVLAFANYYFFNIIEDLDTQWPIVMIVDLALLGIILKKFFQRKNNAKSKKESNLDRSPKADFATFILVFFGGGFLLANFSWWCGENTISCPEYLEFTAGIVYWICVFVLPFIAGKRLKDK